jgi:glucose dehydrogenase
MVLYMGEVNKMRVRDTTLLFLLFIGLKTGIAQDQQFRRVDDGALRNAGKTGEEWLTYGLTSGETRFSPLNQINTGNVGRLGLAWSYDLGPGGGGQEATPLAWNGALYGITNWR